VRPKQKHEYVVTGEDGYTGRRTASGGHVWIGRRSEPRDMKPFESCVAAVHDWRPANLRLQGIGHDVPLRVRGVPVYVGFLLEMLCWVLDGHPSQRVDPYELGTVHHRGVCALVARVPGGRVAVLAQCSDEGEILDLPEGSP
jgi:hypothetical protein